MKFSLSIVSLLGIFAVAVALYVWSNNNNMQQDVKPTYDLSYGDFIAKGEYIEDNKWSYYVEGTLPTPCHEAKILREPLDSDTDNTTIYVNIYLPDPEKVCAQSIQKVTKEGAFTGKKSLNVELKVVEIEHRD